MQGNSRVLVDAEHTYFQPAIDALIIRLQQRCNRHEPIVLNTYQVRHMPVYDFSSLIAHLCPGSQL